MIVPLNEMVRYFAPQVQAAGLYVWGVREVARGVENLIVGRRDGVRVEVSPDWAYGSEDTSFKLLAYRLGKVAAA